MISGRKRTIGFFCSTLPTTEASDRERCRRPHEGQAIRFLERHSRHFWPNAVDPEITASGGTISGRK